MSLNSIISKNFRKFPYLGAFGAQKCVTQQPKSSLPFCVVIPYSIPDLYFDFRLLSLIKIIAWSVHSKIGELPYIFVEAAFWLTKFHIYWLTKNNLCILFCDEKFYQKRNKMTYFDSLEANFIYVSPLSRGTRFAKCSFRHFYRRNVRHWLASQLFLLALRSLNNFSGNDITTT